LFASCWPEKHSSGRASSLALARWPAFCPEFARPHFQPHRAWRALRALQYSTRNRRFPAGNRRLAAAKSEFPDEESPIPDQESFIPDEETSIVGRESTSPCRASHDSRGSHPALDLSGHPFVGCLPKSRVSGRATLAPGPGALLPCMRPARYSAPALS